MASEDDLARRIDELERTVMARVAEQEEQLRALQRRSMPSGGVRLVVFRVRRNVRRIPASARRRYRRRVSDRRIASERPQVPAEVRAARSAIVDRYLDATSTSVFEVESSEGEREASTERRAGSESR
jgi:hypothetical protein